MQLVTFGEIENIFYLKFKSWTKKKMITEIMNRII
ncbi:hypothetical protein GYY_06255 [Methanococcus maripaludis X1]|uniref:Uncharacterized protein n=1 Tax=Methanococcus maripaludis X1 TaxID=1053692 RepID=G0H0N5_METMI|nr:hypothetical protein GYY_06255 [Methanococcus maripaludis X1]